VTDRAGRPGGGDGLGGRREWASDRLQAIEANGREGPNVERQLAGRSTRCHAAASHADINFDQQANHDIGRSGGGGDRERLIEVIDCDLDRRAAGDRDQAIHLDFLDDLIRDQDVVDAVFDQHFRFAQFGTRHADGTGCQLAPRHRHARDS